MGLVVSFVPRVAATHHRSPAAGQAAIIIFPGVRYERVTDADEVHDDVAVSHGMIAGIPPAKPSH